MKKIILTILTLAMTISCVACGTSADLGYTNIVEFGVINSWTGETE